MRHREFLAAVGGMCDRLRKRPRFSKRHRAPRCASAEARQLAATTAAGRVAGGFVFRRCQRTDLAGWRGDFLEMGRALLGWDVPLHQSSGQRKRALFRHGDAGAFPLGRRSAGGSDDSRKSHESVVQVTESLLLGTWNTIAASTNGEAFSGPGFVRETDAGPGRPGIKRVEVRDLVNFPNRPKRFFRIRIKD